MTLYIVATPVGNMQDITLRALEILRSVDFIIAEDTRVTGQLLHHFEIKKPLKALNEFNENMIMYELLEEIKQGRNAALVSDAGTPLISDPGFPIVRLAREKGIQVVPIPGPSAVMTALSAAGLPTDSFLFQGFLPKKKSKVEQFFEYYKNSVFNKDYSPTLVFYESPHRIAETLKIMENIYGNISIVIARELTKLHEEFRKENISTLAEEYTHKEPKGEIVVLVSLK